MGKNKDENTKTNIKHGQKQRQKYKSNIRHRQKQIRKFKDKRKTYMAENKGSLIHKGNRPPPLDKTSRNWRKKTSTPLRLCE